MKKLSIFTTLMIASMLLVFTASEVLAFSYAAATKTARMTAVRDKIDLGAAAGKLEIGSAGMATTCVTITLNGRVEMWRGRIRFDLSVSVPFV